MIYWKIKEFRRGFYDTYYFYPVEMYYRRICFCDYKNREERKEVFTFGVYLICG